VEAQPTPLSHVLGDAVGAELAGLHRLYGAELHTAVRVDHVACDGRGEVRAVVLADGRELPADLVVVGIGAVPATAWLEGSGLPVDDGVVCDERLRVVGHDGIHAAGDVARWPHPWYGPVRIEHWTNAQEHASVVAADICGLTQPAPTAPYVWSDQYGRRIQIVGRPSSAESVTVDGSVLAGRMVALYAGADGVLVGAVVVDDPRLLLQCRRALTRGRQAEELRDEVLVAR
jgi:NADPH-dependent 2,4-dienoyl-CoA reductase/sulfur reductase-like enzyme